MLLFCFIAYVKLSYFISNLKSPLELHLSVNEPSEQSLFIDNREFVEQGQCSHGTVRVAAMRLHTRFTPETAFISLASEVELHF